MAELPQEDTAIAIKVMEKLKLELPSVAIAGVATNFRLLHWHWDVLRRSDGAKHD